MLQLFEWQVLQNQPLTADLLQLHSRNYEPCVLPTELAEQQISRKIPTLKSVYLYHHSLTQLCTICFFILSLSAAKANDQMMINTDALLI